MVSQTRTLGGVSVYTSLPKDPKAVVLSPSASESEPFDHSDMLQAAINRVKDAFNYGIVFIPEGTYWIRKTIHVPKAVRLIGFGQRRPEIRLARKSPGFDQPPAGDKGKARYMFWFTSSVPASVDRVQDANSGTFYSAFSNINLTIEDENPAAVALRTHFAQHCFVSHVDIHIGQGKAGIFDVGNEIDDVRFFGGDYGIDTTKTSPAWPFFMVDTVFEGQRKAAIRSSEAGLTAVRLTARKTPHVMLTRPGFYEKLYMEDCLFEDIDDAALVISNEHNALNQISLLGVDCCNVPTFVRFDESGKTVRYEGESYAVQRWVHGRQKGGLKQEDFTQTDDCVKTQKASAKERKSDLPAIPAVSDWVNVLDLGGVGDGLADNTHVIRQAIETHSVIYFPQGRYRVSDTIELKADTCIIGLHPFATQIFIADNTEPFGGLGAPKAVLQTISHGRNVVSGIGIDAGGRNPRAVGCLWQAGPDSYMNDVKFIGGHGDMNEDGSDAPAYNDSRTADHHPDRTWDSQYWSLWITNGGAGTFKDIWTASPYASAGLYISDTETPGRIYAMSVEHHVRLEVKMRRVSNWKFLALQLEEEVAEGQDCQPIEISDCQDLLFANLFLFRVIWLPKPYPQAIRTWNVTDLEFYNLHNFTQVKLTIDNVVQDMDSGTAIRDWQLAFLRISSQLEGTRLIAGAKPVPLAKGFEFIDAICSDGKGNVYFADGRHKRIYCWSHSQNRLTLVSDLHYKPLSLACDTQGRLIVMAEYFPPSGATCQGWPEKYPLPEDAAGTAYGNWYSRLGSIPVAYSIDPQHPDSSMQRLPQVEFSRLGEVKVAWHPANRWRDNNDYLRVCVRRPQRCFLALDKVTVIPVCYDLIRASSLLPAIPGTTFHAVDEYLKRTVRFEVGSRGELSDPVVLAERGEHHVLASKEGRVYVPEGDLHVHASDGRKLERIEMDERPACLVFANEDQKDLIIAARSTLYGMRLP